VYGHHRVLEINTDIGKEGRAMGGSWFPTFGSSVECCWLVAFKVFLTGGRVGLDQMALAVRNVSLHPSAVFIILKLTNVNSGLRVCGVEGILWSNQIVIKSEDWLDKTNWRVVENDHAIHNDSIHLIQICFEMDCDTIHFEWIQFC
jgi:hypothetical protein